MTHCKTCGKELSNRKNLYCPIHAAATLRKLESTPYTTPDGKPRSGYLEPLTITTSAGGRESLSNRRFLTVRDKR